MKFFWLQYGRHIPGPKFGEVFCLEKFYHKQNEKEFDKAMSDKVLKSRYKTELFMTFQIREASRCNQMQFCS